MAGEIPPGLARRWKAFGSAAKTCWEKIPEELPPAKAFPRFWKCMEKKAGKGRFPSPMTPDLTKKEAKKCRELGIPVEPHPICVLSKTAEGISPGKAAKQCLKEGKYHGISALHCKARLKGT